MEQSLVFIEFEYVFAVSTVLLLLIMYLFYVKFPVNKED